MVWKQVGKKKKKTYQSQDFSCLSVVKRNCGACSDTGFLADKGGFTFYYRQEKFLKQFCWVGK